MADSASASSPAISFSNPYVSQYRAIERASETSTPIQDSLLSTAEELKTEGNDHFRTGRWEEALVAYRAGVGRLPLRKVKPKARGSRDVDGEDEEEDGDDDAKVEEEPAIPPSPEEIEHAKVRAVLYANIGACYVKLDDHKQAVEACTQALLDDPNYIKALQRRAASNDKIDTWSSLTAAQEDYNTLLKLLPQSSPQATEIERSQRLLKPRVEAAQKEETGEMLGKLKNLGDSILGNFGLSTDNFKFEPNGQGGYSMNFTR